MYQIKWIINIYMILSNYARGILLIALNLFKKNLRSDSTEFRSSTRSHDSRYDIYQANPLNCNKEAW